jgi:tyrosyl-tRNA synthetase
MYHSAQSAQRTAEDFQRVFTRRELPERIDQYKVTKKNINIVDLLVECKLMRSRGEAKRKIREGAIDVDGVRVDDIDYVVELKQPIVVRAGKHKFLKVSKK